MADITLEKNFMNSWTTFTGVPLMEAVRKMQELLPPTAYTAVPGATKFTDIDPAYLTLKATEIFGLCGVGWWYEYDETTLGLRPYSYTTSTGKERHETEATINKLALRYRLLDEKGEMHISQPVYANGANSSDEVGYAIRGALTNAIGSAFAKLCWQLPVWLGKVSHENAGKLWQEKQAKAKATAEAAGETNSSGNGGSKPAAQTKATPPDEKPAPAVEPPTVSPPAASVEAPAAQPSAMSIELADSVVIPEGLGVPLAGKSLGVAKKDAMFGLHILRFLSGKHARADGVMFKPETPEHTRLKDAALLLLEAEAANGNGKKPGKK